MKQEREKRFYEAPELEVVQLDVMDITTSSQCNCGCETPIDDGMDRDEAKSL